MSAPPSLTIALADGSLLLDLPSDYSVELEEDGTVCAFPSDQPEILALRFSVLTVSHKDGNLPDLAADLLAGAKNEGYSAESVGDKAWYHEDQDSEQDGVPLWIRFWYIGYKNHKLIISLCCGAVDKAHKQIKSTIAQMPHVIVSARQRNEKSSLTYLELRALDEQRAVIQETFVSNFGAYSLPRLRSDLAALQSLVDSVTWSPEQEYEWSCAGVVFGDVIALELGLEWIAQCDEYGVEPALNLKETSITLFPRSMLIKRVEKGEQPDLAHLFEMLAKNIEELKQQGC
jgi:hypothetical protein